MKRLFKRFIFVLISGSIVFLAIIGYVGAEDLIYNGTAYNDEICFGVVNMANPDTGVLEDRFFILRYTKVGDIESIGYNSWDIDPTGSRVFINGRGGNDRIEAVSPSPRHQTSRYNQTFINMSPLARYEFHLNGDAGHDIILGSPYTDVIHGGSGNDYLNGKAGDDYIQGDSGNDFIIGNTGNDLLYGGSDNDILIGFTGMDFTDGGRGTDTFRCRKADHMQTLYDPSNCSEDCDDGSHFNTHRRSVELTKQYDPYRDWAIVTVYKDGIYYEYQTTSNPDLLLSDRAAGASILFKNGGDIPFSGDFNGDGYDDVGVFRTNTCRWRFNFNTRDTNHIINNVRDGSTFKWGQPNDRPVAGRFDRNGSMSAADGVAIFRPSNGKWYFDYNLDGETDREITSSAKGGDIPIAGDFDGNGFDDVGWFRPSDCKWYIDYNLDGDSELVSVAWGLPGDIPIAGDYNGDGMCDIAVFRPYEGKWCFHWDIFSIPITNADSGPWGSRGDIPVAGDFNGDGTCDTALFRLSNARWYFDLDHDGDTDPAAGIYFGPWGWRGQPLFTIHKQYGSTCGPASLAIVMDYMGLANRSSTSWWFDPDLSLGWTLDRFWPRIEDVVHVGYKLSMEHIMYEGYVNDYEKGNWDTSHPSWYPNHHFANDDFVLNTGHDACGSNDCAEFYGINYRLAWAVWDTNASKWLGDLQKWMINGQAVGTSRNNPDVGLAFVANKYAPADMKDAMPVSTAIPRGDFENLTHLKTVIKNYVNNHIPMVVGVDRGHHFNTIVGYWEMKDGFYIYTADPLDGWGRDYWNKPMRWRRILLNSHTLNQGGVDGLMLFGHSPSGCTGENPWARGIDSSFSGINLCDTLNAD